MDKTTSAPTPPPPPPADQTLEYVAAANTQITRLKAVMDALEERCAMWWPQYAYEQIEPFLLVPAHEKHQALSDMVIRIDNLNIRLETLLNALGGSPI